MVQKHTRLSMTRGDKFAEVLQGTAVMTPGKAWCCLGKGLGQRNTDNCVCGVHLVGF